MTKRLETDVFVAGSGPVGATFARHLVPTGRRVWLADAGAAFSPGPGHNLKNFMAYQRSPDRFAQLVNGLTHPLSEPPRPGMNPHGPGKHVNPRQDPNENLEGATTAYTVGGMGNLWTCVIPRQHRDLERSPLFTDDEWDKLYTEAEQAFHLHTDLYDRSVRHCVVRDALARFYEGRLQSGYRVGALPFAVQPHPDVPGRLKFAGSDTILEPVLDDADARSRFRVLEEHLVRRFLVRSGRVHAAEVLNLRTGETVHVHAETFVAAAGTVLGAQLLWNSEIRPRALGRYLVEHPMCFGQVQLHPELQSQVRDDSRFADVRASALPEDPLRLPAHDLSPNVWVPVCEGRPWHVQVTKDVVHFTPEPAGVDDRVVTDVRFYASVDPDPENRVRFESDLSDAMGMPQPTFHFRFGTADLERLRDMQAEMADAGAAIGSWLAGAEPRMLPSGMCLHLQGACRMGAADDGTSVADRDSKVWGIDNLYIAGNAVIPTGNACNPTLTAAAIATRAAWAIDGRSVLTS